MATLEKVNELNQKLNSLDAQTKSKLVSVLDPNSFVELGAFNEAGVVTGYGTIDGKLTYVYCQNGPVNVRHAKKIANLYSLALNMGAPVVGILDSKGLYLEEGIDNFEAYGIIFSNQAKASGVIPQISVILGDCVGTGTFIPSLSDIVIMTKEGSKLFLTSPNVFSDFEAKVSTVEQLSSGQVHGEKTGFTHLVYDSEAEIYGAVREIVTLLPSNNLDDFQSDCTDDLNREDEVLNTIIDNDYDVKTIISLIADNYKVMELSKDYAKNIVTALVKLNGKTVGIVANNGPLSVEACKKASSFIKLCDSFNIAIISLTNVDGYELSLEQERKGLMKYSANLMFDFASATVPKINLILKNAIGSSYLIMNSKHIGCDLVLAWPTAEIALMNKEASTKIMGTDSDKYDLEANVYSVCEKGYIDDVIIPSQTRKQLLISLEMLSSKSVSNPERKHSTKQM